MIKSLSICTKHYLHKLLDCITRSVHFRVGKYCEAVHFLIIIQDRINLFSFTEPINLLENKL